MNPRPIPPDNGAPEEKSRVDAYTAWVNSLDIKKPGDDYLAIIPFFEEGKKQENNMS